MRRNNKILIKYLYNKITELKFKKTFITYVMGNILKAFITCHQKIINTHINNWSRILGNNSHRRICKSNKYVESI